MEAVPLFDRVGHGPLRAVIEEFYDRMFADDMIGFLFAGKDKATLVQREWEFTARLLGAKLEYTGRSIPEAHRNSPILGGHFERRLELLRQVLAKHRIDAEVVAAWLGHTERMRHLVTRDRGSECRDAALPLASEPVASAAPAATSFTTPSSEIVMLRKKRA